jgi:hypothetical protein
MFWQHSFLPLPCLRRFLYQSWFWSRYSHVYLYVPLGHTGIIIIIYSIISLGMRHNKLWVVVTVGTV